MKTIPSEWYSSLAATQRICEDPRSARKTPEIEVQTRWYAGEFGTHWTTLDAIPLRIVDFGEWNREPGPDFTGATLQLGDGTILRGDVEIDTDVRDWERHGHVDNPAFDRTILHVFSRQPTSRFFTRTREHRLVHQVILPGGQNTPVHNSPTDPLQLCQTQDQAVILLRAAARYRLHRKSLALTRAAEAGGDDLAWYRAFAVTLGYKRNKLPFLLLAERCGPGLAASPGGEALLFGLAGFLDGPEPSLVPVAVRDYLRGLWEKWWPLRTANDRLVISPDLWTLGGIRPANHPHRRTAALVEIARHWKSISSALHTGDRKQFVDALTALEHPFWSFHFNLNAAPLKTPQALIGGQRLQDIVTNLFYPVVLRGHESLWEEFLNEPGSTVERSHWMLASRFFPNLEVDQKFLKAGVHQQGLLQLESDFLSASDPESFAENIRKHLRL